MENTEKKYVFAGHQFAGFIENYPDLKFDCATGSIVQDDFNVGCTDEQFAKYLKTAFRNRERTINRFFEPLERNILNPEHVEVLRILYGEHLENGFKRFKERMLSLFDTVEAFTYKEAFELENAQFRGAVFSVIDVPSMMENLGAKRYKVDGIKTKQKFYDKEGNITKIGENDNIYEVYEMNSKNLTGTDEKLYAVKCWCTSTNKEHWIWIDEKYKDDPLQAIASTFSVPSDAIPFIKALKRQGDILIAEMKENYTAKEPSRPLTKEEYFNLLEAQS